MKLCAWIIVLAAVGGVVFGQDDLPKKGAKDSMDFEPKLMLDGPNAAVPAPTVDAGNRVIELEETLVRAEQQAAGSEALYKEGILAQVEVENRANRVIEVKKELADAKVVVAAGKLDTAKKAMDAHTGAQGDVDSAAAALKSAQDEATKAGADWQAARVGAAELDVKRKKKLYSEGVATKREVETAEDRLTLVTGTGG